jgi:transposase
MQDRELYRRILGIEAPWYVDSVELKLEAGEVHIRLAHHDMIHWPCPECGAPSKLYDHQPERQWRHLDTCQYQTILHAQPPRSECSEHGVHTIRLFGQPLTNFDNRRVRRGEPGCGGRLAGNLGAPGRKRETNGEPENARNAGQIGTCGWSDAVNKLRGNRCREKSWLLR